MEKTLLATLCEKLALEDEGHADEAIGILLGVGFPERQPLAPLAMP